MKHIFLFPFGVFLCGLLCTAMLLVLTGRVASARQLEISYTATTPGSYDSALAKALKRAVFSEAVGLLPPSLSPARKKLLEEYFLERTMHYVLSYSEIQQRTQGNTTHLLLDVTTNRPAIKQEIHRLGLLSTTGTALPFDLRFTGDARSAEQDPAIRRQIQQFMQINGLVRQPGVLPVLELDRKSGEKTNWSARLSTGQQYYTATGENLAAVWFQLWGDFFSTTAPQHSVQSGQGTLILSVTGWFSPDGVFAFDADLTSWTNLVDRAVLQGMLMQPEGIRGQWQLRASNRQQLSQELDRYTRTRGLQYTLGTSVP